MADKEQTERVEPTSAASTEQSHSGPSQPENVLGNNEGLDVVQDLDIDGLKQALDEARVQSQEHWNKLLRAQAEVENLRKRNQRDLENAHKYAIEKFAGALLPVKDSLELGLDHSSEKADAKKLHEGMELTLKMLSQVMEKFNIEEINPQGETFDPERHQAMSTQENAELAPNTVITVMQKGYVLNDRLLRPAMVIVSRQPEDAPSE